MSGKRPARRCRVCQRKLTPSQVTRFGTASDEVVHARHTIENDQTWDPWRKD